MDDSARMEESISPVLSSFPKRFLLLPGFSVESLLLQCDGRFASAPLRKRAEMSANSAGQRDGLDYFPGMKVKFSDYAGVFICFLFSIAGFLIRFYPGVFLFGFGFLVLSISLYTKKKAYKNLSTEFASIEIEGGRKFTQSPLIFYSTSVGLFLAGSGTMFFWDQKIGLLICGAVAAAFGAGLVLSKLLGLFGNQFISFEETGLRVGRNGYSFLIHWDNIAEISLEEWNSVPYVFLEIISYENAEDTIESADREKSALKLRKSCIWNQGYFGNSFVLSTAQFGMDTALFYKALIQYRENPKKREELALRKRIE